MANPLDEVKFQHAVETMSDEEIARRALEIALKQERDARAAAEARVKHIEQALKAAGRVLEPYLAGTRR